MESKVNYTWVGLFVILLTGTIIVMISWLAVGITLKNYNTYLVVMHESVAGITHNSPVKYNGVDVGRVKSIQLCADQPKQVKLFLEIEEHTPITQGTTATLNTQGLTGISFISLQGSDTNNSPIVVLPGEEYPIIKSSPSIFVRLDTALTDLNNNFNQITADFNRVLSEENSQRFKQILTNLNTTTQHLAAQSDQLDQILINTAKSSKSFPMLINALNEHTLPTTNELLNNLTQMSDNLLELSDNLKQNPALLIRGSAKQPLGPGEG